MGVPLIGAGLIGARLPGRSLPSSASRAGAVLTHTADPILVHLSRAAIQRVMAGPI